MTYKRTLNSFLLLTNTLNLLFLVVLGFFAAIAPFQKILYLQMQGMIFGGWIGSVS